MAGSREQVVGRMGFVSGIVVRSGRGRGMAVRGRDEGRFARRQTRMRFEGEPPSEPPDDEAWDWSEFNDESPGRFSWNLLATYQRFVRDFPIVTKMFVGAWITSAGDIVAQVLEKRPDKFELSDFDLRRTLSLTGVFTIVGTPLLHFWFPVLERILPGMVPYKPVKMMMIDQTLMAFTFNSMAVFFMAFLETFDADLSMKRLRRNIWPVLVANWKLWPFAQLINFSLVPLDFRVLWTNAVAFAWTIIMSTLSHA